MNRAPLIFAFAAATVGVWVTSALLTLAARRVALRVGFVDRPGGHKSHVGAMPYGGGCAIVAAAWLAIITGLLAAWLLPESWVAARYGPQALAYLGGVHERTGQMLIILLGGLVLHALGLLDDRRPLSPLPKLAVIIGVALLAATYGRVRVGEALLGTLGSVLATTAWFVVIINALNFLDNMDGLSAGVAAICLAALAVCGLMAEQVFVPALACVFLGAVGGFLLLNFPPARIFMGDAGSLVVGYMLATVSTLTTYYRSTTGYPPYALAMPLVILAVPLYDFTSVVVIRLAEGRNPLRGDQRHFSHRLVERGLSRRAAVFTIYLATATTGLAATLLPDADWRRTLTVLVITVMVLAIIAILEMPLRNRA